MQIFTGIKDGLRKVRSFVLREGRVTKGQQKALDEFWPIYGFELGKDDFVSLGQGREVILEIGFGVGDSLLDMAKRNPDINYLGIEVYKAGIGKFLSQVHAAKLNNIRVMCADAMAVMDSMPDNFLSRVQLFFPDPWVKKRHKKRRIVNQHFLTKVASKLKPEGVLHMATDWEDYAVHMQEELSATSKFKNMHAKFAITDRPKTKFQLRGERLGHIIRDLEYIVIK